MPKTYEPIATQSPSGAASVSFTSIPSTYTDLYVVFTGTTGGGNTKLEYNGDTASNYSCTVLYGNGSSATSARYSFAWIYVIPDTTQIMFRVNIQNYSNTTTFKSSVSRADIASASTTGAVQLWRSTAAINRVDLIASGAGTFTGTFTLYGIKAA